MIAKGKRGIVRIDKEKGICVKELNPDAKTDRLHIEAEFLKLLNTHGIGPKFISFKDNKIAMEYIEGVLILDYIADAIPEEIINVFDDLIKQMIVLDTLGINKLEMTHPQKHIIVREKKPVMIDFERCRYTEKPKNVAQLVQFITSTNVLAVLKEKHINVDKLHSIELMRKYKRGEPLCMKELQQEKS